MIRLKKVTDELGSSFIIFFEEGELRKPLLIMGFDDLKNQIARIEEAKEIPIDELVRGH